MKHFYLYSDRVEIIISNGNKHIVYFNEYSGRIYYRHKINTISNVRHPGIFLGTDRNKQRWYFHNHFENGHPVIEIEQGFSKGQKLYVDERQSSLGRLVTIENALNEVLDRKAYDWLDNNCQSFVNRICFNQNRSEAIENWTAGILTGLLLIAGFKASGN